ncbi:MAG: heavy metal-binding domain-containing protein [Vicinamibacteria bacterium]|nr:heavy metal-binding domain-containing protein [Vicinamibacteria bacterium]
MNVCPKCSFQLPAPSDSCPKCGVIFARFSAEKARVPAAQVVVSTTMISEPFSVLAPVYALATNKGGQLDAAARKLGINVKSTSDSEVLGALFLGDSSANYEAFPIAWHVCIEQLKRQAASLGGDAVVGVRMVFETDRSGIGLSHFTMHVYGTAVRRKG